MQDISVSLTVEDDCQANKLGAMAGAVTLPYLPDSGLFRTMRHPRQTGKSTTALTAIRHAPRL